MLSISKFVLHSSKNLRFVPFLSQMDVSSTSQSYIRRINRPLDTQNDIYIARYDRELGTAIPIADPIIPDDVKEILPLPFKNPTRYSRIYRLLSRVSVTNEVNWLMLTVIGLFLINLFDCFRRPFRVT